jgi:protein TonB
VINAAPLRFEYPIVADPALSGKVGLRLLIGTAGSVQGVSVLTGKRILADASVKAVRRWRYRPFELDGHPVEAEANITISFVGDDAVSIDFHY